MGAIDRLAVLFGNHGLRRRLGFGQWHADAEYAAFTLPRAHLQGMPEHVTQAVCNRQAQAQAFFGTGLVAIQAFELFKNDLQLVGGNTRAPIPHLKAQLATSATHTQQHRSFGVAEGIGQEVLQNASQQFDVATDPQTAAAHSEAQTLFLSLGGELIPQGVKQVIKGKRLDVRGYLSVF